MVVKEAELLFQAQALDMPTIKLHKSGNGWTVTLNGTHKLNPLLETARGQIRIFKRLDAAVQLLFKIGFTQLNITQQ